MALTAKGLQTIRATLLILTASLVGPWVATAQEIAVHNVVFEAPRGQTERKVVNVVIIWAPESQQDGVWVFLHARTETMAWRRLAIERTGAIAPDAHLTAGPPPSCHVAEGGTGVLCRAPGAAGDVRWVVALPIEGPLEPEGLEIVASGLRVSPEPPPRDTGPLAFVAADRVTEAAYADFLNTAIAADEERAARADRFCAVECSLERAVDRYNARRPSDLRAVPLADRAAFAGWAGLDSAFRLRLSAPQAVALPVGLEFSVVGSQPSRLGSQAFGDGSARCAPPSPRRRHARQGSKR